MMQEWDPVGVCSRDLRECLRVQADVFGCDDLELTIIDAAMPIVVASVRQEK